MRVIPSCPTYRTSKLFRRLAQELQRSHVARFNAEGVRTVPLGVSLEEELRILSKLSHPHVISLQEALAGCGVVKGGRTTLGFCFLQAPLLIFLPRKTRTIANTINGSIICVFFRAPLAWRF